MPVLTSGWWTLLILPALQAAIRAANTNVDLLSYVSRGTFTLDCAAKCVMLCYSCYFACLSHSLLERGMGGALGIGTAPAGFQARCPPESAAFGERVSVTWLQSILRLLPFPARR